MSIEKQLHKAHVAILHVLLFRPDARFAELQKASELSSDHFNFYLKQLIDEQFVAKNAAGAYHLTQKGKEFANRFDTDERTVERQPKVAVCLWIIDDQGRMLTQQRLKQPYFGYWGRPTGKIRWGETILEAAERELMEETGLRADLSFDSVYHKMDFNEETGDMLEDKIFFMIKGVNPTGTLIETFEGGKNAWLTAEEFMLQPLRFGNATLVSEESGTENAPLIPLKEERHNYSPQNY